MHMKIGALVKLGALCLATFVPAAAQACSCVWTEDVNDPRLQATVAAVEYIALGEFRASETGDFRILRVEKAIKGDMPEIIEVRVDVPFVSADGNTIVVNSCAVSAVIGPRRLWALERTGGEWTFASLCIQDAVQQAYASIESSTLSIHSGKKAGSRIDQPGAVIAVQGSDCSNSRRSLG